MRILNSVSESRFRTVIPPISAQRGFARSGEGGEVSSHSLSEAAARALDRGGRALDSIALIRRHDPARARLAENAPGSSGCVFDAP